jgi:hypothetical protein
MAADWRASTGSAVGELVRGRSLPLHPAGDKLLPVSKSCARRAMNTAGAGDRSTSHSSTAV